MSAARAHDECQRLDGWLMAHLDGELDVAHAIEVEEHLHRCEACREQLATQRATRTSLERVVAVRAPASLRERVSQTLLDARAEGAAPSSSREGAAELAGAPAPSSTVAGELPSAGLAATASGGRAQGVELRHVLPLAAAATLALVIGALGMWTRPGSLLSASASGQPTSVPLRAAAALDGMIDDLVAQHANPPPPESTDPAALERFDPYIGVRVRQPTFKRVDAHYVGARMQRRSALLQYVMRKRHRVSLLIFDSKKVPVRAQRLHERRYGARDVYMGRVRGYSVAASERNGIGYAMASDLDDDENARLVLMAAR